MGTKVEDKAASTKEAAADTPPNTEATQQQPTPKITDEAKSSTEAQSPVTEPPVTTEKQPNSQQGDLQGNAMDDGKPSLIKGEETKANTTTTAESKDVKPKNSQVAKKPQAAKKVNENAKQTDAQVQTLEKNLFELRIKNNGRRRLLQFCGVFLEAGQTTIVTLQNQPEVDHVKDTLRQFNELAGRDDLIVEETE